MSIEFLVWVMAICLALFPLACYLDALLGGWRTLAARYPDSAKQRPGGLRMYFQTIYLENGGTGYRNLVVVTIYQDGMQLDMLFPISRLFYPPMFLPWKEIVLATRVQQLMFDGVRLTFAQSPDEPVTIPCSLEERIFNSVGPVWTYPSCAIPRRFLAK
jgi:hypothetical protein